MMTVHQLPFAQINILREDIAEVIIDEGVEMDQAMVDQYHAFLLNYLVAPFSLLINKVNAYTYSFEAQQSIASLNEINAIAVVVYSRMSKISTDNLLAFPRPQPWKVNMFYDRDSALDWLVLQQQQSLYEPD